MKIRKIIDICKRSKNLFLFESENVQWISDGLAIYPLLNLPHFDEDSICEVYDINDKQAEKIKFRHEDALPGNLDFSDWTPEENNVAPCSLRLVNAGEEIIPYLTSQGALFIYQRYLAPLSDIEGDMLELYERQTKNGQIYFAVKSGTVLLALILPADVLNDQFVDRLKHLSAMCEVSNHNRIPADERREDNEMEGEDG